MVTNIASPYRLHELGVLRTCLEQRGCRLRVWFMSETERDRSWQFDPADARFSHRIARGRTVYPRADVPLHLAPGIWSDALRSRPTWLLLGGMWYQPAVVASIFTSRPGTRVLFWNENSATSPSQRQGLAERARQFVLSRVDGFVVPGEAARRWTRRFSDAPALHLANFVDERLFRDRVDQLRACRAELRRQWGFSRMDLVFLWPARLHPRKNILPFLESIRDVPGDYHIFIAGEGPQREEIERFLAVHRIKNVTLGGHQTQHKLIELYAISDALLLPSSFEPFGFVAVEALWAGLPLVMSSAAGATPEVLADGNGWVVDPGDPRSLRDAFADAVGIGPEGLAVMGACSRSLASERFDSMRSASSFVDTLLETFPP